MLANGNDQADNTIISEQKDQQAVELAKCTINPGYFIDSYCKIDNPNKPGSEWFDFKLWPAQREAIKVLSKNKKTIILKARQLGITWLTLGYALWLMLFKPGSVILLFSKTEDDAKELMRRLRGMRERLPEWLKRPAVKELEKELELDNKSRAKSFTTTKHSGRSFTATFVLVDEAAFIPFLAQLLNAAEETVDEGGSLAIISTNDKEKPNNGFADLYRRTRDGKTDYTPLFIPWYGRPTRTDEWYEHKVRTKKIDDLWQEYPEVPDQALAGLSSNKRYSKEWLTRSTRNPSELTQYGRIGLPAINGIKYYDKPIASREYLITADPAEGDIKSDFSALSVWDTLMWEEVAFGQGKWEPGLLSSFLYRMAIIYNNAVICVERNNHGHAVLLALKEIYSYRNIYKSPFDRKLGWLTSPRTKVLMTDKMAELLEMGEIGIRSKEILAQLANIEAASLEAPEGDNDDAAMVATMAAAALTWKSIGRAAQNKRLPVPTMTY